MGCDIHMRAEVRRDGAWTPVGEVFDSLWRDEAKTAEPYGGRNYDLFAMLADVRNGHGFAGIPTGEGFAPIAAPRGIPQDAHPETLEFARSYGVDGHSHSWHALADLRAYDWDGQSTVRYGVVPADEYERLRAEGATPHSWSSAVSGPGVVTFSEQGYEDWKASGRPDPGLLGGEVKPRVRMMWRVSYRDAAGAAWFTAMERLASLVPQGGSESDVRIVFFFDN